MFLTAQPGGHHAAIAVPVYWREDAAEAKAETYIYLLLGRMAPDTVRFNAMRAAVRFGQPILGERPQGTIPLYIPVTSGSSPTAMCSDGDLGAFFGVHADGRGGYDGLRVANLLSKLGYSDTAAIVAVSRKPIGTASQAILVDLSHTGSQAYGALIATVENAQDGSIFTARPARRIFPYVVINFVASGGRLVQALAGERAQAASPGCP